MLTGLAIGFVLGYWICYRRSKEAIEGLLHGLSKETFLSVAKESGWLDSEAH